MKPKLAARCTAVVEPHLEPGEQIVLCSSAVIGKVPLKKQIGVAAVAAIATAGMLMVAVRPHACFLVITDRRVFMLVNRRGRLGGVEAVLDRNGLTIDPIRRHVTTISATVHLAGSDETVRLGWGGFQRAKGQRIIDALREPVARAAGDTV